MKLIDTLANKLGYIPAAQAARQQAIANHHIKDLQQQVRQLEEMHIKELTRAIRTVNMVKVMHEGMDEMMVAQHGNIIQEATTKLSRPRQPEWIRITAGLEIEALRRIYDEIMAIGKSYEYEYFVEVILREVRTNINALMRIGDWK